MKNNTWELTPLPSDRTTVSCRWTFKFKQGYKDVSNRYKARLVARGFTQQHGVDYKETFAPVVKHTTLRIILGLIASMDLETAQLDVKTAFLYGDLEEEIYMDQPEGYTSTNVEQVKKKIKN